MSNKRSLDDGEDFEEPTCSKKISCDKNESSLDSNYYIIRKSKSTGIKNDSMNCDNFDTDFFDSKKDNFKKRSFDRFSNISSKNTEISKKKNLESFFENKDSDTFPYKVKIPTTLKNDYYKKNYEDKHFERKNFVSDKKSPEIERISLLKSTKELREKFLNLAKSKNLNLLYHLKLNFGNHIVETTSFNDFDQLERKIYTLGIEKLNSETYDKPDDDEFIVEKIKEILKYEDSKLLFKTEIPLQYFKKFNKKIPSNWFDKISSSTSFKLEQIGCGDFITIQLIQ